MLRVGDMVHVPAGEMHWHGASRETVMAHTAISLGSELLSISFGFVLGMGGGSGFMGLFRVVGVLL